MQWTLIHLFLAGGEVADVVVGLMSLLIRYTWSAQVFFNVAEEQLRHQTGKTDDNYFKVYLSKLHSGPKNEIRGLIKRRKIKNATEAKHTSSGRLLPRGLIIPRNKIKGNRITWVPL